MFVARGCLFFFFPCLSQNAWSPSFSTHSIRSPFRRPQIGWNRLLQIECIHYTSLLHTITTFIT